MYEYTHESQRIRISAYSEFQPLSLAAMPRVRNSRNASIHDAVALICNIHQVQSRAQYLSAGGLEHFAIAAVMCFTHMRERFWNVAVTDLPFNFLLFDREVGASVLLDARQVPPRVAGPAVSRFEGMETCNKLLDDRGHLRVTAFTVQVEGGSAEHLAALIIDARSLAWIKHKFGVDDSKVGRVMSVNLRRYQQYLSSCDMGPRTSPFRYNLNHTFSEADLVSMTCGPVERSACRGCGALRNGNGVKLSVCNGCFSVWYCGRECQRKDWPGHKGSCQGSTQMVVVKDEWDAFLKSYTGPTCDRRRG